MLGALHLPLLFAFIKIAVHLLCAVCCSLGILTSLLSQLKMSLSCTFLDGDAYVCFPVLDSWEEQGSLLNFAPVP